MIRELSGVLWQTRRARRRYPPPPGMVGENGDVICGIDVSEDLEYRLKRIYTEHGGSPNAVRRAIGAAGLIGSATLLAARHGLRTYLFDDKNTAHEIPVLPHEELPVNLKARQFAETWSLTEMLRREAGVVPGATLEYGFLLMEAAHDNPELSLRVVDRRGLHHPIELSLPLEQFIKSQEE